MEANINAAIKNGFLQQIRFLIEYGHSVNERDSELKTPLINCAFIDNELWALGIARLFLEKEGRINFYDKFGLNALHYAVLQEKKLLVDLYLNALDYNINAIDKFGNTALHYAASTGNVDILQSLVNVYCKFKFNVDRGNRKGQTALIVAWKSGNFECGEMLVNVAGASEEARDKTEGITAREWQKRAEKRLRQEEQLRMKNAQIRPKSSVAKGEIKSLRKPKIVIERPKSSVITRPKSSGTVPQFSRRYKDDNPIPQVLRETKTAVRYRAASISDLRNNPKYVFQISPIEYFTSDSVNNYSYPFAPYHRCISASSKSNSNKYSLSPGANTKVESELNSDWRNALNSYMSSYDYQFAHSYRRSAVPLAEPEPEETADEMTESMVGSDVEEHSSQTSKKAQKHGSDKKHEKHPHHGDKKKESNGSSKHQDSSTRSKKLSLAVPPNINQADSSSSESIDKKGLQKRSSKLDESGLKDKRNSKSKDGLQSRTSFIKK